MEEMTTSSQSLADMAETLQTLVAQFTLTDQAPARRELGRPAKAQETPRNGKTPHLASTRTLYKA
jgi:hypothetical protein